MIGAIKMKKLRKRFAREDGNILLLFAGSLILIIFMIGIALDLGMIYMRRNDLVDLCQLARDERFTYQDTIRYSDNPGRETYNIVANTMRNNGFNGTITVFFFEREPEHNYRDYRVRIQLTEQYRYTFLRLFGGDTVAITTWLDGGENYGESGADMIWYPKLPCSEYNGSYTGTADGPFVYNPADFPTDWDL